MSLILSNDQIPGTDQKRPILLRGGTLHTVSGDVLEKYDLLFAEGKIITIDAVSYTHLTLPTILRV